MTILPTEAKARKDIPLCTGVFDYFPLALIEVAKVSKLGNDQHNPGQALHWNRAKSADFSDTIARHLLERGAVDTDGMRHSAKLAWRALALLQVEMEQELKLPISRGSRQSRRKSRSQGTAKRSLALSLLKLVQRLNLKTRSLRK